MNPLRGVDLLPCMLGGWTTLRWERAPRFYRVHIEQDLWSEWTLTRVHGRIGSARGRAATVWQGPLSALPACLAAIARRRHTRGYQLIHYDPITAKENTMEPVKEVLRLIRRQAEIHTAMRVPGGIRITEERELLAIAEQLKQYPAAMRAALEAAQQLHRPADSLAVEDVERCAGLHPTGESTLAA